MSVPLTINGAIFNYPVNFDTNWGIDATGWAQAVTSGMLQKAGGAFTLTADVNFGASFGIISTYFTSRATNPSTLGTLRLASADPGIGFRNNTDSGNLILTTNSSNNLTYTSGLELFNSLILHDHSGVSFQDLGSTHTIDMRSASTTASYSLILPPNAGSNGQVLQTDGSGTTTWVNATGTGTINSGTASRLSVYNTTGNTLSDSYIQNARNISIEHEAQGSRFVDVVLTIPNVGDGNTGSFFIMADINGGALQTIFTPIQLSVATNQLSLGNFNTITLNAVNPSANRIYTLPDVGSAASFVMTEGNQTINGTKTFTSLAITSNNVLGTTTNDNAPVGYIGEYIEDNTAGFVSFASTGVDSIVAGIPLSAGDWDVYVNGTATSGGTTNFSHVEWYSSATGPGSTGYNSFSADHPSTVIATAGSGGPAPVRYSLAAPTTVSLHILANYSSSTPQFQGKISARRMR